VLLGNTPPDPRRYGRLVTDGDYVMRIVEYEDASDAERAIPFCNTGGLMAGALDMHCWLQAVQPFNKKGEYYLTDIVRNCPRRRQTRRRHRSAVRGMHGHQFPRRAGGGRGRGAEPPAGGRNGSRRGDTGARAVFFSTDTILAPDVTIALMSCLAPAFRLPPARK